MCTQSIWYVQYMRALYITLDIETAENSETNAIDMIDKILRIDNKYNELNRIFYPFLYVFL